MPRKPKQKGYYCYLLVSLKSGRTYIGYTSDPYRRLRQHNGEIQGGARSTHAHRPYRLHCIVGRFKTPSQAMKFEYRWKHGAKGLEGRLIGVAKLLSRDEWKGKHARLVSA